MRKNALTLCCCTGVLAAFGAFFRWVQNQVSFEAETGLAVPGSVWSYLVAAWMVVAAAVLGMQCLRLKNQQRMHRPETFAEAFGNASRIAGIMACVFGGLMALGGVILLVTLPATELQRPLLRILAVVAIAVGVTFPIQLRGAAEREASAGTAVLAALPIVLFAFWLIVSYKINIVNPTISAYAVEILALSAATIGFYQIAGFAFGRPKAVRSVFWCQFAAFLCLMTLSDSRYAGAQCMFAAAAGMLLLQSWLVVAGVRPMSEIPAPEPEPEPEEET